MISEHLLEELRQLKRVDKLRVIQMLVNQIAEEEEILTGTTYEVWSPYDSPDAAAILMDMLIDMPEISDNDAFETALLAEIESYFRGQPPLSETIIEERQTDP